MIKSVDCCERDLYEVKGLLLDTNNQSVAKAMDAIDRNVLSKIIGAAVEICRIRRLPRPRTDITLLKKLRLELGLSPDELAKDASKALWDQWYEVERERERQHNEKQLAKMTDRQRDLYKRGILTIPGFQRRPKPYALTGHNVGKLEMRCHREEAKADHVSALEKFFNRSWEQLMTFAMEAPPESSEKPKKPTKPVTEQPVGTMPVDISPVDAGQPVEQTAAVG